MTTATATKPQKIKFNIYAWCDHNIPDGSIGVMRIEMCQAFASEARKQGMDWNTIRSIYCDALMLDPGFKGMPVVDHLAEYCE